ncbi:2-keto-3-deoxy-L-rhamnonate aldolase like protein [Verticillium longisporum]|nr:2-keto-3-deoxy-L-rhamnonate aldolase like protein [Verticillium longisporum]
MSAYPNRLNELAAQDKVCKVFGIKVLTALETPRFVANAGFNGIFIDLEHSTLSLGTASELCVTSMTAGISPFVRVPGHVGRGFVQRVLDGGAQGVIFPHVDTVEQAQEAVRACKFPPLGKRSITGTLPHFGYKSASVDKVIEVGNASLSSVFVMIESPEAVDRIDDIASVEGVDVIMVGSNDLSIELGIPGKWDSPVFDDAVRKISQAAKRHGRLLALAGIYDRPDIMHKCIHEYGVRWIVVQHDLSMMAKFMSAAVKDVVALEETKILKA